MSNLLGQFEKQQFLNLETFRKDGTGVKTPLWFVEKDGKLYMRTATESWKIKRLKRDGQAKVAVSDYKGTLLERMEWVEGTAVVYDAEEKEWVHHAFNKKYGLMKRLIDLGNFFRRNNKFSVIEFYVPG